MLATRRRAGRGGGAAGTRGRHQVGAGFERELSERAGSERDAQACAEGKPGDRRPAGALAVDVLPPALQIAGEVSAQVDAREGPLVGEDRTSPDGGGRDPRVDGWQAHAPGDEPRAQLE